MRMPHVAETIIEPLAKAVCDLGAHIANIVAPLRSQARAAALSYLDEQKQRAAHEMAAFADIMRRSAQPAQPDDPSAVAECAIHLAERVDDLAGTVSDRSCAAILADAEALARRQPALFLLSSVAIGLAIGFILKPPGPKKTALQGEEP
jgi:hypothetical protein